MDLIALLPAPLITLVVAVLKYLKLPGEAAPWVALALAVIATIAIHVLGLSQTFLTDALTFLVAWLGSMGTHEAAKNVSNVGKARPTNA